MWIKWKIKLYNSIPVVYNISILNVYEVVNLSIEKKKAEMVRRAKVVKFVRLETKVYENLVDGGASESYLRAYSNLLDKMVIEFDITPDEIGGNRNG